MRMTKVVIGGAAVLAALSVTVPATAATAGRASPPPAVGHPAAPRPALTYSHLSLVNGDWAQVYSDGLAEVFSPDGKSMMTRVPMLPSGRLPDKSFVASQLERGPAQPYAPNEVLVIYRSGGPALTRTLAALGTDRSQALFTGATLTKMRSLRDAAQRSTGRAMLDFPDARLLHITASSVSAAVTQLRANPAVAFAEPNWIATPTDLTPSPVPAAQQRTAVRQQAAFHHGAATRTSHADAAGVPANYDLASSAQSLLNAPGVNAVPAFSEIAKRYGQLPGQGEIITNVSLGDLTDASAVTNSHDACNPFARHYGPTTIVKNGQRYLDWPSMPLIPTYTANSAGKLNPLGETCGSDPFNTEVGLDFSMMAPLPDKDQRAGETGSGLSDLLGIAPGASYRLVVPGTPGGAMSDVDAAFLAAATQNPRPDVITASLGFGFDSYGLPSRYLEDDAMTQAVIASIVAKGIVVCVSANDGLRTYTNAAVAPSGGSVATNVTARPSKVTSLDDVQYSDAPSAVLDSGSIDVGASTLDDIFAAPPNNPANAASSWVQAYPTTRFDGFRLFSSGFGSRVNVAAPGDDVLSIDHKSGGAADAVQLLDEGGTSASAPETAAAAAVVLQVARLTRNHRLAGNPAAVRAFLARTGTPMPGLAQADRPINVGPQINVGNAVETLLRGSAPAVARVAVAQRQNQDQFGGVFLTQTVQANISLTGALADSWITIAPDWTGLPRDVRFELSGPSRTLATTRWARLQPAAILASAGMPLISAKTRTVTLTYSALHGHSVIARTKVTLTFGPCDGTVSSVQAPIVPQVAGGAYIPVRYDTTGLTGPAKLELVVGHPGRVDPQAGEEFRPAYTVPLTKHKGIVNVPVAALDGAGVYGIGIQSPMTNPYVPPIAYSVFAYTRVPAAGNGQPLPPTLSVTGSVPAHLLDVGYRGSFELHYDVSDVAGATGAVAEFSAPGPTELGSYDTFNNPGGSRRDHNGFDTGSVAYVPLPGTRGTVMLSAVKIGLVPAAYHLVRVLATRHGSVTGEASGGSMIVRNGILPSDGGSVQGGFGINPAGTDGLLTSDQLTASGAVAGSVEKFNQNTGATSVVASSSHLLTTVGNSSGILTGDTGLYSDTNPSTGQQTYDMLHPVAAGTSPAPWDPPAGIGALWAVAANTSTSRNALLSGDATSGYYVTPANIAKDTFGKPVSLRSVLSGMVGPYPRGFAVNPKTGTAMVAVTDDSMKLTVVIVDGSSGKVTAFPAPSEVNQAGPFVGVTINPALNEAYIGTIYGGFIAMNLRSHAMRLLVPDAGVGYEYPTIVPGTNDIMMEEFASPNGWGFEETLDNNALSSVLIVSPNGKLLHRYEQFNFFGLFGRRETGAWLQPNPVTSTGWAIGPGGLQLEPFSYSTGASPKH